MAFPTDEPLLGPPSYGPRKGTEGVVWHSTEGADTSRAAAVATARWQATPGATTGSYNWIIYDGGLLLTVPYLEASGGLATGVAPYWQPGRYTFLKANLSSAAYADPNAYLLNVAFSGKAASFRDGKMPQNMIETAVALTRWVEAQNWSTRPLVHSGHLNWQTNRSDPSQLVLNQIAALYAPEDDMQFWKPVQEDFTTIDGTKFWDGSGVYKQFTSIERVTSIAESSDDKYRLLRYGAELLVAVRAGMNVVKDTRIPTTGYGFPSQSGFTRADLDAANAEGFKAGKADMHAKAIVAAENNLSTVRGMK